MIPSFRIFRIEYTYEHVGLSNGVPNQRTVLAVGGAVRIRCVD